MGAYKHHKYFEKIKNQQSFLFPNVCLICRKSFKKPFSHEPRSCPQCGRILIALNRKFSAPKMDDIAQWKKVQYLIEQGFLFQTVYDIDNGVGRVASYPQTLKEAEIFVQKYKCQSKKTHEIH